MVTKPSRTDKAPLEDQPIADNPVAPVESAAEPAKPAYLAKLEQRAREADTRIDQKKQSAEATEKAKKQEHERNVKRLFASNTTIQKRAAAVEANMERLEGQGLFAQFPIAPQNQFPTLLTRIPLFPPSHRIKQQKRADIDTAIEFETPFGAGKRYGPPLTTKEEDILIALLRLRSRKLYGKPESLPAGVSDIYTKSANGKVGVHCTICSMTDILEELGLSDAGENYKEALKSIKRLGATTLELNLNKHERYLGLVKTGRMIPIIHVQWQTWDSDGLIFVVFPPVIAQWLDQEYTWIDWDIRRQLPPLGKAIHRFLSGQKTTYRRKLLEIGGTIGYDGASKNIKTLFRQQLDKLIELGWLESYAFDGSARKGGVYLRTTKARKKKVTNRSTP